MHKILLLISFLTLSACSGLGALIPGPGVSANVQAGQTNQQTIGFTQNEAAPSVTLRPNSRVETIDQSQTVNNDLPDSVWILLLVMLVLGWIVDTPATIIRKIIEYRKNRKNPENIS